MSVSIRKIEGVESVQVSLKNGTARITLKAGNSVTLQQLRELVRRNGFTPRQAAITAHVDVVGKGSQLEVKIAGVNDIFQVESAPSATTARADLRLHAGQRVVIEGVVPAPVEEQAPLIQVTSVKPSSGKGP